MRFVITVYPENSVQEKALVNLGLSKNFDIEPFAYESEQWNDILPIINELAENGLNCCWNLEFNPA